MCIEADLAVVLCVRSLGASTVRSSATRAFKAALSSYGNVGRDRQRNRAFLSGMLRGVSSPSEGSKILSFVFRPRLVYSSLLHLRTSWKENSANFAFTVLRSSFTSRAALPWCSDVLCALAHIHSTQTRVGCVRCVANRPPAA